MVYILAYMLLLIYHEIYHILDFSNRRDYNTIFKPSYNTMYSPYKCMFPINYNIVISVLASLTNSISWKQ